MCKPQSSLLLINMHTGTYIDKIIIHAIHFKTNAPSQVSLGSLANSYYWSTVEPPLTDILYRYFQSEGVKEF